MARMFVVVATVGRAELTCQTVSLLHDQSRKPDGVIVVGASAADVAGLDIVSGNPQVILSEKGLCRQRNAGLDAISGKADVVIFFDDDFIPAPDYLEQVEKLFEANPDIVGVTGELVGDGIGGVGYSVEEALNLIASDNGQVATKRPMRPRRALYGCNMSIRLSAAKDLRFDEHLPLYGWQEDIDFTFQLGQRGRLVSLGKITGVHMGTKGGRTSGRKLGYSQIANIVYLKRKGTMPARLGERLIFNNLVTNVLRSFAPEPHIDRRGRLVGNALAIRDLLLGKLDPRRIEMM